MAKVKLGSREFDADCEEIAVPWHCGTISDAECVALGARMKVGEFQRLRIMQLVSFLFLSKMFAAGNTLFAVSLFEFSFLSLLALNLHGPTGQHRNSRRGREFFGGGTEVQFKRSEAGSCELWGSRFN
jgi:hypothetical protein